MRKVQMGVMGSCADLQYTDLVAQQAEALGRYVAEKGALLLFGAEKDCDSLSTAACRGAHAAGGLTLGVTYGKHKNVVEKDADIIIVSGSERGGPRESNLVMSCDVIITVSGGSGTMTEILVAYQSDIPMVGLVGTGGWTDRVAGQLIDGRDRRRLLPAQSPQEAVELAYRLALEYIEKYEKKDK